MQNVKAREGQWYLHQVSRESFCVINVDEAHRIIDVRDDSGDIDEFDFEEWATMDLELCLPPSGWVALSDGEDEEYEYGPEDSSPGSESPGVGDSRRHPARTH